MAADLGGDFLGHYRSMAEGIIQGITGEEIKWDEDSPLWDLALMTYHPDGKPMLNSSRWFHKDAWLDFNMIETHRHRDSIYAAVQQDYLLKNPIKPTIMGEPAYEGEYKPHGISQGIHMRRQAYQTFFARAAGFTYGGFRDKNGNGPLFSPFKGWEELLNMKGAESMKHLKQFCLENDWPNWTPVHDTLVGDSGKGEFQKVAVKTSDGKLLVYFPDDPEATISVGNILHSDSLKVSWFVAKSGEYSSSFQTDFDSKEMKFKAPADTDDVILIIAKL